MGALLPAPAGAQATADMRLPDHAGRRPESAPFDLPPADGNAPFNHATTLLGDWFVALGAPAGDESFGDFLVRAAALMLGRPYGYNVEIPGQEIVDCSVDKFQCESYVESSLGVARCAWLGDATAQCFRREVSKMRYRDGTIDGYSSRLHYFEDWLADNARRGVLTLHSGRLGGKKMQRSTAYMTDHADAYPALQDSNERRRIAAMEARLSRRPVEVILRRDVANVEHSLQNGDIVAIVTRRPDILVHHAGLVERDARGRVHLLHASSAHGRVLRTVEGIAAYLHRRGERQGVMVARPEAPQASLQRVHVQAKERVASRRTRRRARRAALPAAVPAQPTVPPTVQSKVR